QSGPKCGNAAILRRSDPEAVSRHCHLRRKDRHANSVGGFRARCLASWRRFMPGDATSKTINAAPLNRLGAEFEIDPGLTGLNELEKIAGHRSHRRYLPRPIEGDLLRLLCACALSAPSKSDLQQCDIIIVSDATIRKSIVSFIPEMPWINDAPV